MAHVLVCNILFRQRIFDSIHRYFNSFLSQFNITLPKRHSQTTLKKLQYSVDYLLRPLRKSSLILIFLSLFETHFRPLGWLTKKKAHKSALNANLIYIRSFSFKNIRRVKKLIQRENYSHICFSKQ